MSAPRTDRKFSRKIRQVFSLTDFVPQSGYGTQPRVVAPRGYPGIQGSNHSYPATGLRLSLNTYNKSLGDPLYPHFLDPPKHPNKLSANSTRLRKQPDRMLAPRAAKRSVGKLHENNLACEAGGRNHTNELHQKTIRSRAFNSSSNGNLLRCCS